MDAAPRQRDHHSRGVGAKHIPVCGGAKTKQGELIRHSFFRRRSRATHNATVPSMMGDTARISSPRRGRARAGDGRRRVRAGDPQTPAPRPGAGNPQTPAPPAPEGGTPPSSRLRWRPVATAVGCCLEEADARERGAEREATQQARRRRARVAEGMVSEL